MTTRALAGLVGLNVGLRRGRARHRSTRSAASALEDVAAARGSRLPPRCRRLRRRLDAAPRRRRPVQRLGDRPLARRRAAGSAAVVGSARRSRGCRGSRGGVPRDGPGAPRHRGGHRARRPPARGALPLGAPAEPAGVRRVGVLGAEGEGDLLLRRPRRAGLHDLGRARRTRRSLPILDAAAFHAMGGVDVVTLHLQFWFLLVGGVAALAGCLYRHVPAWLLWPSLLARARRAPLRRAPSHAAGRRPRRRPLRRRRAALALWLGDGRGWRLAAAAVLLAGATLTKREGLAVRRMRHRSRGYRCSWRSPTASLAGARRASRSSSSRRRFPWRLWYARAT